MKKLLLVMLLMSTGLIKAFGDIEVNITFDNSHDTYEGSHDNTTSATSSD